ncbi:hypothetical protein [Endothiovibrio diazotrophicus]
MAGAVAKREAEFLAGRLCARCAFALGDFEETAVAEGEGRAQRWSVGAVGSINHTDGAAVAMVARGEAVLRQLEPLSAEFPRARGFRAFHYHSEGLVRSMVAVPLDEREGTR